jgi:diacylglycerol kinase (ATP)
VLNGGSGVDQGSIELERRKQGLRDGSNAASALLVVNGRASGVPEPGRMAAELAAMLAEYEVGVDLAVTFEPRDLWEALAEAAAAERRAVLVGGDGSVHAAANAPLARLPELALVPAGRANNIARALRIPTDRAGAVAVAARASARPLDTLLVRTPERTVHAVEAVSAGFQAEARLDYDAENSGDLRQGLSVLAHAVQGFEPYRIRARLDRGDLNSSRGAQLFLSNLPYFGFGFEVDPGADPADGHLEAILIEASHRRTLLRLLGAAYGGRHLGHPGVRRVRTSRARLTEPLPLVADAEPLGTTTATVTVAPAHLRVAAPARPGERHE